MESYTTEEGIVHCSTCSAALSKTEIENDYCGWCNQVENEDMSDCDEVEFQRCSSCDGHDACEDFGCAFELGLGHLVAHPL